MGKLKWIVGIIVLVIVGLVGYSYFSYEVAKREALKDCEFRLTDVGIARIGLTSADLIIVFEIYNPNDITATLDRVDFSLYGNDNYLGDGEITKKVNIPPYSKKRVSAPFTLYYSGAAGVIWSALKEGEVVWKITGIAYIDTLLGTMEIPFVFTTQKSKEIVHTGVEQATTQKSKEVVHTSVERATISIELSGDVIGHGWKYGKVDHSTGYWDDSTGDYWSYYAWNNGTDKNRADPDNLTVVEFYLTLTAGRHPISMDNLKISYTDKDTHEGNIPRSTNENASLGNLTMPSWNYTIIHGDEDALLEFGEIARIIVAPPEYGVTANQEFTIEVKPAEGATLTITRTAPPAIDKTMSLH